MSERRCDLGLVGLGVMGRNLLLNFADHGFAVAGYDRDAEQVAALRHEADVAHVIAEDSLPGLMEHLESPRVVLLSVPAGRAVDSVVHELKPRLSQGDILIDGGNSHYRDTNRRCASLAKVGLHFLGVGISGGEAGARHGPCLMPGGSVAAYDRVRPLFEAAAARVHDQPCVAWIGPDSAGHFVKMVHNGIEYGIMQAIAEAYHLLRAVGQLNNDRLSTIFGEWNHAELEGYLMEATSRILALSEDDTGRGLIDLIRDEASQKGTGKWTSQVAMDLQTPVPTIDLAVSMRHLSSLKQERIPAAIVPPSAPALDDTHTEALILQVRRSLRATLMIVFAQGLALLHTASQRFKYRLKLQEITAIWRGGCIIRTALLDQIRQIYEHTPELPNLLLDPTYTREITGLLGDQRQLVSLALQQALPVPAFMSAIAWFDAYRSPWLPANLVQAQRDYFGSHGYRRIDQPGTFHTDWQQQTVLS